MHKRPSVRGTGPVVRAAHNYYVSNVAGAGHWAVWHNRHEEQASYVWRG